MFTETLKIVPKLDSAQLSQMERTLSSRFKKVAKGFGKGLVGAISAGGVLGIATSLIDKLLNPLKETQEAIDRTLNGADDAVTNAEQFNSTPGELFKLQKLAQAKGLDASSLDVLLTKYQGALADAKADPSKDTSVRQFANDQNIVESFFQFMQNLNKLPREQQVRVQAEVFGEKQTLKMAEFLRADFAQLQKQTGIKGAETYTPSLEKLANLNDLADALKAGREANDMVTKGRLINGGMIRSRDEADAIALKRENESVANFKNLQALSNTSNEIMNLVQKGVNLLGDTIVEVTPMIKSLAKSAENMVETFKNSSVFRLFGGGKKDK